MNKFIVITTINEPTLAVKKYSKLKDWNIVVVGDKKTPPNWEYKNVKYLSIGEQVVNNYRISNSLPWNHYSRKMLGYLYAIENGADIIADTDDDNIPLDNWGEISLTSNVKISGADFYNIYTKFTKRKVWPRGYPLSRINTKVNDKYEKTNDKIGIYQYLADLNPDVDAIYRLTNNKLIKFKKSYGAILDKGCYTPINSQNTFFIKEYFPLMYLPIDVSFRFTDILRGYIIQPILWSRNAYVYFGGATVKQIRNEHNLMKDFEDEVDIYLDIEDIVELLNKIMLDKGTILTCLKKIYNILYKNNYVTKKEIKSVEYWIDDMKKLGYE